MKPATSKQAPAPNAKSAQQGTSTGSGSRPGGGKYPIKTSAPSSAKNHRG